MLRLRAVGEVVSEDARVERGWGEEEEGRTGWVRGPRCRRSRRTRGSRRGRAAGAATGFRPARTGSSSGEEPAGTTSRAPESAGHEGACCTELDVQRTLSMSLAVALVQLRTTPCCGEKREMRTRRRRRPRLASRPRPPHCLCCSLSRLAHYSRPLATWTRSTTKTSARPSRGRRVLPTRPRQTRPRPRHSPRTTRPTPTTPLQASVGPTLAKAASAARARQTPTRAPTQHSQARPPQAARPCTTSRSATARSSSRAPATRSSRTSSAQRSVLLLLLLDPRARTLRIARAAKLTLLASSYPTDRPPKLRQQDAVRTPPLPRLCLPARRARQGLSRLRCPAPAREAPHGCVPLSLFYSLARPCADREPTRRVRHRRPLQPRLYRAATSRVRPPLVLLERRL